MRNLNHCDDMLLRAGYRCEYCRHHIIECKWEREHITPRVGGGSDDGVNLSVACNTCNRNKGTKTSGRDRVSGATVLLFNPRLDKWEEHFEQYRGEIVGTTPKGRVTAELLFRATRQQLPRDLQWWPILELRDRNENLYLFLNHQRARRLANQFSAINPDFAEGNALRNVSAIDRTIARFAGLLLSLESLFMQSTPLDVEYGLTLASRVLRTRGLSTRYRLELLHIRSILFPQYATALAFFGKFEKARSIQRCATSDFTRRLQGLEDDDRHHHWPHLQLRLVSFANKFDTADCDLYSMHHLREMSDQANEGEFDGLIQLSDVELCQRIPSRKIELLLGEVARQMERCGYGQDFDYARGVAIRRRWWALQAFANTGIDLELLISDLRFWRSLKMENELRALSLALARVRRSANSRIVHEMREMINKELSERRPGRRLKLSSW